MTSVGSKTYKFYVSTFAVVQWTDPCTWCVLRR